MPFSPPVEPGVRNGTFTPRPLSEKTRSLPLPVGRNADFLFRYSFSSFDWFTREDGLRQDQADLLSGERTFFQGDREAAPTPRAGLEPGRNRPAGLLREKLAAQSPTIPSR